jgi:hypothetical protein
LAKLPRALAWGGGKPDICLRGLLGKKKIEILKKVIYQIQIPKNKIIYKNYSPILNIKLLISCGLYVSLYAIFLAAQTEKKKSWQCSNTLF